jgi:hypothetical protein
VSERRPGSTARDLLESAVLVAGLPALDVAALVWALR